MIPKTNLVMVETSAWIETLRPKGDAQVREKVAKLLRDRRVAWCSMIKLELWNGALAKEMPDLEALDKVVVALEITPRVWDVANELARNARAQGKTFPSADLLIAACARTHDIEIFHRDKHFDLIEKL